MILNISFGLRVVSNRRVRKFRSIISFRVEPFDFPFVVFIHVLGYVLSIVTFLILYLDFELHRAPFWPFSFLQFDPSRHRFVMALTATMNICGQAPLSAFGWACRAEPTAS